MDGLLDSGFDCRPWLKGKAPEPWPEPLLEGLREVLAPAQIPVLESRSPWGAEGAWAILQGIRAMGPKLGNRAGTLWNALVQERKGAVRLERAGPLLREFGWKVEPEDGTPGGCILRALWGKRLAKEGLVRLPLFGEAAERHRRLVPSAQHAGQGHGDGF